MQSRLEAYPFVCSSELLPEIGNAVCPICVARRWD